jgi:hypothetical protein
VRKAIWAALVLSLGLAAPAAAQQNTFFGSGPRQIQFVPVDTTKGLAAPVLPIPQNNQGFSLTNFFSKLNPMNLFSNQTVGTSTFPAGQKSKIYPVLPPNQ